MSNHSQRDRLSRTTIVRYLVAACICLVVANAVSAVLIAKMALSQAESRGPRAQDHPQSFDISACYKDGAEMPEAFLVDRSSGRVLHLKHTYVKEGRIVWECQELFPRLEKGAITEGLSYVNYQDHMRLLEERLKELPGQKTATARK